MQLFLLLVHLLSKKTLENIFKKINACDRANAVTIAFIHNILNAKILTQMSKTDKVLNFEKHREIYANIHKQNSKKS